MNDYVKIQRATHENRYGLEFGVNEKTRLQHSINGIDTSHTIFVREHFY